MNIGTHLPDANVVSSGPFSPALDHVRSLLVHFTLTETESPQNLLYQHLAHVMTWNV